MRLSCLSHPAAGVAFICNGALRGSGDTKFPVVVRATGTWGLRVPLATALIPFMALPGARLAMAIDFCTQAGLSYRRRPREGHGQPPGLDPPRGLEPAHARAHPARPAATARVRP